MALWITVKNLSTQRIESEAAKEPLTAAPPETPVDGIDRAMNMLKTKLATSVSKILGATPLVNTLDKARKALHKKENCQNIYYQNKCKDTLASVQTQVVAAHQKYTKEIEKWDREFVVKNGLYQLLNTFNLRWLS